MSKIKDTTYADFYTCDMCELEDGRPTLSWKEKDFDLCYECLDKLFFEHRAKEYKVNEVVSVRRKMISEELRNQVLKKCGYKCVVCDDVVHLQLDHIKPFSLGGETIIENLQILCRTCNLIKGKSYGR